MVHSVYLPFFVVKSYTRGMPYPAKTNAQTILAAAIDHLEQYGEEALSMRELASRLGISPHALYRYYPDRAALQAALAEEGFHPPGLLQAEHEMWGFVVGLVENAVGQEIAASAAVALWAFLHGFIQLESAALLGEQKPRSGFQVGLEAFLSGLTSLSSTTSR